MAGGTGDAVGGGGRLVGTLGGDAMVDGQIGEAGLHVAVKIQDNWAMAASWALSICANGLAGAGFTRALARACAAVVAASVEEVCGTGHSWGGILRFLLCVLL